MSIEATPRGAEVVRRAKQLGLTAEYVGPGVKINGRTWPVSHADAYLQGYFDGAGRAFRSESEHRRPLARKCPGGCGRPILYGTCMECAATSEQRRLERVIEIARDHDPQLIDGIMEKTT